MPKRQPEHELDCLSLWLAVLLIAVLDLDFPPERDSALAFLQTRFARDLLRSVGIDPETDNMMEKAPEIAQALSEYRYES